MKRSATLLSGLLIGLAMTAATHAIAAEDDDDDEDGPGGARVSVDAELLAPINESNLDAGAGGGLRLGYELDLLLLTLTPEIGGTAHSFAGNWEPELYRGVAGLRLSVGKILEPGLFAHVGVGDLRLDESSRRDANRTSFTGDCGITLDLTLLPLIDLGVHASYGFLAAGEAERTFDWVTAGGHLTLTF